MKFYIFIIRFKPIFIVCDININVNVKEKHLIKIRYLRHDYITELFLIF